METEGVNQPETSRQMPGKLDHCSCLCYCVAKAAAAEELDALSSRHNHFDGNHYQTVDMQFQRRIFMLKKRLFFSKLTVF